eukprot:1152157-Pelagomonas_calceolata.AAC.4
MAQRQHADVCKNKSGKAVKLHSIFQGIVGTSSTEHALNRFKKLGLDHQCAIELARKRHGQSVAYANKLVNRKKRKKETLSMQLVTT